MQHTVRPGEVDWTGDNPFIYLKESSAANDWSSLSLYFRVAVSRHGSGEMMLVLERPHDQVSVGCARLCLTSNATLARYLLTDFVKRFGLFRPFATLIDEIEPIDGASFEARGDGVGQYTASAQHLAQDLSVSMLWRHLDRPFLADVGTADTQTGLHQMLSVFQPANRAEVIVNGRRLVGQTVERDFFGRRAQSAALAHSETWLRM